MQITEITYFFVYISRYFTIISIKRDLTFCVNEIFSLSKLNYYTRLALILSCFILRNLAHVTLRVLVGSIARFKFKLLNMT